MKRIGERLVIGWILAATGCVGAIDEDVASSGAGAAARVARERVVLARIPELTRTVSSDGQVDQIEAPTVAVGDTAGNLQEKAFLAFDLGTLPAGAIVESATLILERDSLVGTPATFGRISVLHVHAPVLGKSAFGAPPLGVVGDVAVGATGVVSIDVTAEVAADLADRVELEDRTQIRLELPLATDGDGAPDTAYHRKNGAIIACDYKLDAKN